jgi:hypothetical protein
MKVEHLLSDRAEYEADYPHYCRRCQGWGKIRAGNPDVGFLDCECMENGLCPRCGRQDTLDETHTCRDCSWHEDDPHRGLPGSMIV